MRYIGQVVPRKPLKHLLMKINLITLLICLGISQVDANTYAQQVTLNYRNAPLETVLKDLEKQSGYTFFYRKQEVTAVKNVDVNISNLALDQALDKVFKRSDFSYEFFEKTIVIKRAPLQIEKAGLPESLTLNKIVDKKQQEYVVIGRVMDEHGKPFKGATIRVKSDSRKTTASKDDGSFLLSLESMDDVIVLSYIGCTTQEIKAWKGEKVITLTKTENNIEGVEISTGIFNRKKETFTGAVASFSGNELRQVGNLNVVQSLKTLDPSFVIAVDNSFGSNPNQMPKIEVRGKSSFSTSEVRDQFSTDPNQPLFILNGMETSLQQIIDLDISRVASITLLKDASSTALYGARAANGVVVVETLMPTPGKMHLTLSTDFRFEAPDLSAYNMMNAEENLFFQKEAGVFNATYGLSQVDQDNRFNDKLIDVRSGLNSYWLNVPLRNSFTKGTSVRASGGSEELQYNVGLNYRMLDGVMKGSGRETWGGDIYLSYRTGKLNVTNNLYVNGTVANESPYGSFQDYVNISPFYRKYNEDGSLFTDKYLEFHTVESNNVANPLYNAFLEHLDRTNRLSLQNTLNLIYDIDNSWRLSGGLHVVKNMNKVTQFTASEHSRFDNVDVYEKGLYSERNIDALNYQGHLMMTYRKVLQEKHSLNGNIRAEIQQLGQEASGYSATGFPSGTKPNPAFAYGYLPNQKPLYSKTLTRRVNVLGSFNYAYDNKYFFDLNYRLDGSTSFGADRKYSPFWSAGLGWNIHKEFANYSNWLSLLRLRTSVGTTGNQALGSYASSAIYLYENDINYFGQALNLNQLGNPNLEWSTTRNINLGLDVGIDNDRFTSTINFYEKYTTNLVAMGTLPSSAGVKTTALNVGQLRNRGVEFTIRYSPDTRW